VSRNHASLELKDGKYLLADQESINGTHVNGQKITETVEVTASDRIQIGKFRLSMVKTQGKGDKARIIGKPQSPPASDEIQDTHYIPPREISVISV
jgi:pSer/pThr/pTyr-binding forkhead associated (FHA) protein